MCGWGQSEFQFIALYFVMAINNHHWLVAIGGDSPETVGGDISTLALRQRASSDPCQYRIDYEPVAEVDLLFMGHVFGFIYLSSAGYFNGQ